MLWRGVTGPLLPPQPCVPAHRYLCPDLMVDRLGHCSVEENLCVFHFLSIVGGRSPFANLQEQTSIPLAVLLDIEAATVWAGNTPTRIFPSMSPESESRPDRNSQKHPKCREQGGRPFLWRKDGLCVAPKLGKEDFINMSPLISNFLGSCHIVSGL